MEVVSITFLRTGCAGDHRHGNLLNAAQSLESAMQKLLTREQERDLHEDGEGIRVKDVIRMQDTAPLNYRESWYSRVNIPPY